MPIFSVFSVDVYEGCSLIVEKNQDVGLDEKALHTLLHSVGLIGDWGSLLFTSSYCCFVLFIYRDAFYFILYFPPCVPSVRGVRWLIVRWYFGRMRLANGYQRKLLPDNGRCSQVLSLICRYYTDITRLLYFYFYRTPPHSKHCRTTH